ncbi:biogenesis of lysosome-related organelles complex 1 subunit 3 [Prorops nasuta]|uniref:biogenesis of lysosome-related organelles complex 1 subunit 3 n=1 Tax=Prorops nasuta TaxID=863751 RepID=UPI0034CFEBC7
MDLKAVVVPGEAPESDDDTMSITTNVGFPSVQTAKLCGTIISGEAPESDDDGTSLSSMSGAIDAMACAPYTDVRVPKSKKSSIKYNSLLHKKLYECNEALGRDVLHLCEGTIAVGVQELSAAHKQLLKSELTIQEAVCQLRIASNRFKEVSNTLHQIVDAGFLHSIKI